MLPKKTLKGTFAPPALSTLFQPELLSILGGPGAQAVGDCWRGRRVVVGVSGMGKKPRRSRPPGGTLAALRDMASSLRHEVPLGTQDNLWLSPGKLLRRVLSEEGGKCYSPPPNCGHSRAEEEEGGRGRRRE
jgi:hypothetical protein